MVDPATSADLERLGARLRRYRQARRLSLRDLGGLTGTTASFLSQLERGASGATIGTLMKIADALAITVADLFDEAPQTLHRVLRRADRPVLPQAAGYRKALLSRRPIGAFEVYVGHFDAGGSTGEEPYTHGDSQEMMLVLAGAVDITLGGELHRLAAGDCIEYRSSVPHRIVNPGPDPAEVQWIISPATSDRAELDLYTRRDRP